jgi:shikimate kinase
MKILLFGVSNVGKTTIGELLAERLDFKFYDLDEEVKTFFGMTLEEFVHTADLRWRDHQRGIIIKRGIRRDYYAPCTDVSG